MNLVPEGLATVLCLLGVLCFLFKWQFKGKET